MPELTSLRIKETRKLIGECSQIVAGLRAFMLTNGLARRERRMWHNLENASEKMSLQFELEDEREKARLDLEEEYEFRSL